MDAQIDFSHYKCELDNADINYLISTFYQEAAMWTELQKLATVKTPRFISSHKATYPKELLLSANIAYVESVYSNPIADLLETDKWKRGNRKFPYIGLYPPLRINETVSKKASEGVTGALGEIIGGTLFETQARICVRPIQKYPDLIGNLDGDNWAFMEAKTFFNFVGKGNNFYKRVPSILVKEILIRALNDLLIEPSLLIYGSFTNIESYDPLKIKQTILEIADKDRKNHLSTSNTPPKVIENIQQEIIENVLSETEKEFKEMPEISKAELSIEGMKERFEHRVFSESQKVESSIGLGEGKLVDNTFKKKLKEKIESSQKTLTDIKEGTLLNFSPNPLSNKPMQMQKVSEVEDRAIYMQILDNKELGKVDSQRIPGKWERHLLDHNGDQFFLLGNSFIGLSDKNKTPKNVSSYDFRKWKQLP